MVFPSLAVFIRIIILIAFSSLFFIVLRKYQNYQEKPLISVLFLSVVGVISTLLETIQLETTSYGLIQFFRFLLLYGTFRLVFAFAILFYFEYHQFYRPKLRSIGILIYGVCLSLGVLLTLLNLDYRGVNLPRSPFVYAPFIALSVGLGLFYAGIMFAYYWYQNYSDAINKKQRIQLISFLGGYIIWFIIPNGFIPLMIFSGVTTQITVLSINIIIPSLMLFGIILVIFAFGYSKQVIIPGIRLVDNLLVIDKSGIPLYNYKFQENLQTQDELLSGGISAITSVLQESVGVKSQVRSIKFEKKVLTIHTISDIGFILISDHHTSYLEYGLQVFSKNFMKKVDLDNKHIRKNTKDMDNLVMKSFGNFEEISNM